MASTSRRAFRAGIRPVAPAPAVHDQRAAPADVLLDASDWAAIIPSLRYAELVDHVRAIELADVDSVTLDLVASRLTDPLEVAASRLSPFRLWSAYAHSGSELFGPELAQATQLSLANVPALGGRTLVLVDTSGSMDAPISGHAGVRAFEIGAVLAAAFADAARRGGGSIELVLYGTDSVRRSIPTSVTTLVDDVARTIGTVGHGSETWANAHRWFDGHDRVLVCTDAQHHPGDPAAGVDAWPCPIYVWDLRGFGQADVDAARGRYLFAGFTDAAFRLVPLLERGRDTLVSSRPAHASPIAV